jgi:excisionase family DNA binding protein
LPEFLTVEQAAEKLQLTPGTIYSKIRNGIIPTHPWSEKPRIPLEALNNWDVDSSETFKERKLRQEIELKDREIQDLRNKLRQITRIGLETEF